MSELEDRISLIEARNARVTYDKSWETSWLRRDDYGHHLCLRFYHA